MKECYKVLIVDDEPFAREGLELMVNWNQLGFELAGSAENGRQALEMIAEYQPDLVITDLLMPEMGGIELIDYVRKHMFYQPEFVILSGYGTFDYAKEAIRLDVNHYILKPIMRNEVQQKLADIKTDMDSQRQGHKIWEKINRGLGKLSCSYLAWLLNGQAGEEEVYKLEIILKLKEKYRRLAVVKSMSGKDEEKNRDMLTGVLKKMHIIPEPYEIMFLTPNFAVLIVDYEEENFEKVLLQTLSADTDSAHIVLNLGLVSSCREIREAWKLVEQVMDYCFYREYENRTFCMEDMEMLCQKNREFSNELLKETGTESLSDACYVRACCAALRDHNVEPEQLRIVVFVRLLELQDESGEELRQQIRWMLFEELKDIWIWVVREKKEDCDTENITNQIKTYMEAHFCENITIYDMAQEFHYNEVYLGKLVKRKIGMTFRQYLNKVRMDYAERLLKESRDSVIEISYASGFSNPDYFCKKFRERNGMTPTEFRKRDKKYAKG